MTPSRHSAGNPVPPGTSARVLAALDAALTRAEDVNPSRDQATQRAAGLEPANRTLDAAIQNLNDAVAASRKRHNQG